MAAAIIPFPGTPAEPTAAIAASRGPVAALNEASAARAANLLTAGIIEHALAEIGEARPSSLRFDTWCAIEVLQDALSSLRRAAGTTSAQNG